MIMRRAVTFVAVLIFMMGAEGPSGCEGGGSGNGGANPGATRHVTPRQPINPPRPNPDHGPKTPAPIAGDPKPEDHRTYVLEATWTPAKEFVKIQWGVGSKGPIIPREFGGGRWGEVVVINGKQTASLEVSWTGTSWDRIQDKGTHITCKILVNGKQYGPDWYGEANGQRWVGCNVQKAHIP